jgi:hypothetical protein
MDKNKKWYIDQYNRNRSYKNQVTSWEKLKIKQKLELHGNKETLQTTARLPSNRPI